MLSYLLLRVVNLPRTPPAVNCSFVRTSSLNFASIYMFSSLFRMVVIEMPQTSMMSSAYPYFHISHLEGLTCCHVCVSSLQQYSNIHQNVCCQAVPECDTFPRDANLHISSLRSNIISIRHLFLDFKECMFVLSPVAYFLYQLSDLQLLNKFSVA